ncbi:hypothetical protein [Gordonia rhizosphera]|uniref:Peptidase MA-like domain-containing protein n=1 Tax=Gordonia rhizosphera NBRC 16068 TaxID=1108045 RepID=K6V331_9ACTN|nr:hypothetical protein GORHZ_102_00550 [Gordonia rhizosphera NBRC 16068]
MGTALVVVAVNAGCTTAAQAPVAVSTSSSTSPTTTTSVNVYEQQRAAGAQAALDELGTALLAGDTARLDAVIDAAASPAFRAGMHIAAVNLSGGAENPDPLRLKEFRYQLAPTQEAETLLGPSLQSRLDVQGSSDSWVAPVELHYALGGSSTPGIDEPEVVVPTQLVMARYADSWKVVGDARAIGGTAGPTQLWDLPGLAVDDVTTAGGESVVATYPGTGDVATRLPDQLPRAIDAVTRFWGAEWPRRAVVVVTARAEEFEALAHSAADISGAAAATVFTRVDTTAHEAVGQRVILTPGAREFPTPVLGVVLRHELTHVAMRADTSPGAPLWITEGVPEYVGRKGTYTRFADAAPDLAEQVRAGAVPADLPTDGDFAVDTARATVAYQSAWSVAAYVAERFGEHGLKELYMGVAGTGDPARHDAAIETAIGLSRAQLVADWRRWLTEQVR